MKVSRNKNLGSKLRLNKRAKQNRTVPMWVVARTDRKVQRNRKRYNWRRSKLKRD